MNLKSNTANKEELAKDCIKEIKLILPALESGVKSQAYRRLLVLKITAGIT